MIPSWGYSTMKQKAPSTVRTTPALLHRFVMEWQHLQQQQQHHEFTTCPPIYVLSNKVRPRLLGVNSHSFRKNDALLTVRRTVTTSPWMMMTTGKTSTRSSTTTDTASRQYSSPTSNAFWRDLNLAVTHGDGDQAESIVNGLFESSSPPISTRILSLALEAWKRSNDPFAAERAQQLFDRMIQWASEGTITDPPSVDDYHTVLDCWVAFSESLNDGRFSQQLDGNSHANACTMAAEAALTMTHRMMQSRPPTPEMVRGVLQILANGGQAERAVIFLDTMNTNMTMTLDMYNLVLEAYARSTDNPRVAPHAAQALLRDMQETNNHDENESMLPKPNGASYDWVLQCWAANAKYHRFNAINNAQLLLAEMNTNKLQTTGNSYQAVISILAEAGEALQAENLLSSWLKDYSDQFDAQLKPTTESFETVFFAYSKSYFPEAAHRATSLLMRMRELHETGWLTNPPGIWPYNLVLKCWMHYQPGFSKGKGNNFSQQHDPIKWSLQILDLMREEDGGVTPDSSTMNTVLNTIANQPGNAIRAEQFLWDFYRSYLEDPIRNPQPDVISFGTVLKAWAKSNDPQAGERADAIFLKLQSLHESLGWPQCQPDHAIYSSVMKCYATSMEATRGTNYVNLDLPYKAEAILRSMQKAAQAENNPYLKPNTVCWNMAIKAWAQAGQGPRAEALFQEMFQEYLEEKKMGAAAPAAIPNNVTFAVVLTAWAKTHQNSQAPTRAETILDQMKQLATSSDSVLPDVKPNVVIYSIVLDCLAYSKSISGAVRAERLLREMQASDDPAVQPNVVSYNSVIKAWSLSRDPNALFKVTALLDEMLEHTERQQQQKQGGTDQPCLRPNANTFGSVLKVLADNQGVPDKETRAHAVVKLMEKFGIQWNDWSLKQMRRCCGDEPQNGDGPPQGQRRRQRRYNNKPAADDLPAVPDLKYN